MKRLLPYLLLLLLVCCQDNRQHTRSNGLSGVEYATGFSIEEHADYTLVHVHNPWQKDRTLQTYVLVNKQRKLPADLPAGIVIRTPLERTVSFSAITCGMLEELGVTSTIVGLTEPQYVNVPSLREGISAGTIADLGQASNPNIEKLLLIAPEAVFINPFSDEGSTALLRTGIPIIDCIDYLEKDPLGQSEWIRFLGLLFEKQELADSLFFDTERNYHELTELISEIDQRPSVFTETKYGDFWYMPGGKSYMANMLRDAGADYLWKENDETGSITLSFETVLNQAENHDFWLMKAFRPNDELTYEELKKNYSNYALFKAYQERNIYVCNTARVPYYEDMALHPDRLLKDLVAIFHPELLPNHQLYYYQPMVSE